MQNPTIIDRADLFTVRLLCTLILLALMTIPPAASSGLAATKCGSGGCRTYFPFTAKAPPTPLPVAPVNATQTGSLAPMLSWTQLISGTYLIQVSTDPSFATTVVNTAIRVEDPLPSQVTHVLGNNLGEATLFYWRVGLRLSGGYLFSPTWSFATPTMNSRLLPLPPHLLAPPNHTTLVAQQTTLSWAAVPSALYYRIRVENLDGTIFALEFRDASATTLPITGLAAATTYTWRVKVLNQYGWGNYQTQWDFRTP